MSGICAVLSRGAGAPAARLTAIAEGLSIATERVELLSDQCAGIGVSARYDKQQCCQTPDVMLACDTDLYNEDELRGLIEGECQARGERSTAAMLAGLYARFGPGFVEKLRGPFAILLWDVREQRLLAAIDGFGIRRLAYYEAPGLLLIASRVDALARCGEVPRDVNPRAIVNVLNFTSNLAPETIFSKVHRFPAGNIMLSTGGVTRVSPYWDMRYGLGGESNEDRLSRELEDVVERAVAVHCKDTFSAGVGAYLSGGTDSSTVLGMMTRAARGPVKAFSIGFEEQSFNELRYAELAAKQFGSEHHTYLVGARDCYEALPKMIRTFDEPFGNSSAIPTYFCARLAAQNGVNTLLAGDGGDELFGGNERYATDKIFEIYGSVPGLLRKGLIEPFLGALPIQSGLIGRARRYIEKANMPGVERMLCFQFLRTHALPEIFDESFLKSLGSYTIVDIPAGHYGRAAAKDHLDRLLYVDLKITLADNDLPKVTCMSEMAGIQTRFPFLDRSVAEFSGHIPARLKVKGFEKRYLFKKAFRNLLPAEIIKKRKHGFGLPVATWMRSDPRMRELSRDILLSNRAFERGYFQRSFIEKLFQSHDTDETSYYGDTIWTFLVLELWQRQFIDAPAGVNAS